MTATTHLAVDAGPRLRVAACLPTSYRSPQVTGDVAKVTCGNCLRTTEAQRTHQNGSDGPGDAA